MPLSPIDFPKEAFSCALSDSAGIRKLQLGLVAPLVVLIILIIAKNFS
jgi:hypothetical protein